MSKYLFLVDDYTTDSLSIAQVNGDGEPPAGFTAFDARGAAVGAPGSIILFGGGGYDDHKTILTPSKGDVVFATKIARFFDVNVDEYAKDLEYADEGDGLIKEIKAVHGGIPKNIPTVHHSAISNSDLVFMRYDDDTYGWYGYYHNDRSDIIDIVAGGRVIYVDKTGILRYQSDNSTFITASSGSLRSKTNSQDAFKRAMRGI